MLKILAIFSLSLIAIEEDAIDFRSCRTDAHGSQEYLVRGHSRNALMDPSSLQSASRVLESSLDNWGRVLLVATLVVVIGLVLEYGHEFKEAWLHLRWPMARFPWDRLIALSGGILVTLGVAGELYATYMASRVEARLRDNNHKIEALLTREAGNAKESADGAAAASSRAKSSADDANEVAGKAQKRVAEVAKRANEVDRDLAMTQFLLSARSVQNRDVLADRLKQQFQGRDVVLRSYIGDPEGWGLCTQLWYVAHSAEMNPKNDCGMGQLTPTLISPLAISGPDIDETVKLAGLLNGIGRVGGWSAIKAPVLTIFVGVKSPFVIGQARGIKAPAKKRQ